MNERLQGLKIVTFDLKDQAGDDREIFFKVPGEPAGWDVLECSITLHAGTTADGSNFIVMTLQDAGSDGTGTAAIATRGGASVAWVADGVYDLAMTGSIPYPIDADDWIAMGWAETGTWAMVGTVTVVLAPGQRGTA
jgi:hypothetical protein